jgi:hypothetical protein
VPFGTLQERDLHVHSSHHLRDVLRVSLGHFQQRYQPERTLFRLSGHVPAPL